MKKLIMAVAALAAMAIPASASAFVSNPDTNLRIEGQLVDVSANAVEGQVINCPTTTPLAFQTCWANLVTGTLPPGGTGGKALLNPFGPVLDSDLEYREEFGSDLRQLLEWKAKGLRIQSGFQTAMPAPDGTLLQTDVYKVQSVNVAGCFNASPLPSVGNPAGCPGQLVSQTSFPTGLNTLVFFGTVHEPDGVTPKLATVAGGEAELKAEFRSGGGPADDIPDINTGDCAAEVLVNFANGTASAAGVFNNQTGANC